MTYKSIANYQLKNKSILYDIRRQMLESYFSYKSYRQVAKMFGVNVKTVIKWVKRYKTNSLKGL